MTYQELAQKHIELNNEILVYLNEYKQKLVELNKSYEGSASFVNDDYLQVKDLIKELNESINGEKTELLGPEDRKIQQFKKLWSEGETMSDIAWLMSIDITEVEELANKYGH